MWLVYQVSRDRLIAPDTFATHKARSINYDLYVVFVKNYTSLASELLKDLFVLLPECHVVVSNSVYDVIRAVLSGCLIVLLFCEECAVCLRWIRINKIQSIWITSVQWYVNCESTGIVSCVSKQYFLGGRKRACWSTRGQTKSVTAISDLENSWTHQPD